MRGDTNYTWISSGLTATSSNAAHNIFGAYDGLSALNSADVVYIQLRAATADLLIFPTEGASVQSGMSIFADQSYYVDLPSIKVSRARNFHMRNATNGSNGTMSFVIWSRVA